MTRLATIIRVLFVSGCCCVCAQGAADASWRRKEGKGRFMRFLETETTMRQSIGSDCLGGENQNFLEVNNVHGPGPYTIPKGDAKGEQIMPQISRDRSEGTCQPTLSCDDTPTKSSNGASGCDLLPADITCCSITPCQELSTGKEGVCKDYSKCEAPDFRYISDQVYVGKAKGATGCRHLPDEIRCCVPVADPIVITTGAPEVTPPNTCDECGVEDAAYCAAAVASCTECCTTKSLNECIQCLETQGSSECCPCLKKKVPNLACTSGPCTECMKNVLDCEDDCTGSPPDFSKCLACLGKDDLHKKCCPCVKKILPMVPDSFTCTFTEECQQCAADVAKCVTDPGAPCGSSRSTVKCVNCIMTANTPNCCDCIKTAATQAGVSFSTPITCPIPAQCSDCGNAMVQCEAVCRLDGGPPPNIVDCGKCLQRNGALQCCDCFTTLPGVSIPGGCDALNSAITTGGGIVSKIAGLI